jgi:hypothetical protein
LDIRATTATRPTRPAAATAVCVAAIAVSMCAWKGRCAWTRYRILIKRVQPRSNKLVFGLVKHLEPQLWRFRKPNASRPPALPLFTRLSSLNFCHIDCQSTANRLPIDCQSTANRLSLSLTTSACLSFAPIAPLRHRYRTPTGCWPLATADHANMLSLLSRTTHRFQSSFLSSTASPLAVLGRVNYSSLPEPDCTPTHRYRYASDHHYHQRESLRTWITKNSWVRDLDWPTHKPVYTQEKVLRQCPACHRYRHIKLWWQDKKTDDFLCHPCFTNDWSRVLPIGYEDKVFGRRKSSETKPGSPFKPEP